MNVKISTDGITWKQVGGITEYGIFTDTAKQSEAVETVIVNGVEWNLEKLEYNAVKRGHTVEEYIKYLEDCTTADSLQQMVADMDEMYFNEAIRGTPCPQSFFDGMPQNADGSPCIWCFADGTRRSSVMYAIMHLNDDHKISREEIADRLDKLHDDGIIDLTITSKDPDRA